MRNTTNPWRSFLETDRGQLSEALLSLVGKYSSKSKHPDEVTAEDIDALIESTRKRHADLVRELDLLTLQVSTLERDSDELKRMVAEGTFAQYWDTLRDERKRQFDSRTAQLMSA